MVPGLFRAIVDEADSLLIDEAVTPLIISNSPDGDPNEKFYRAAAELAEHLELNKDFTIDWTVRENVRAQLRVIVKRILRKYGYPPDKQEKATQTVLEQAEVLCAEVT